MSDSSSMPSGASFSATGGVAAATASQPTDSISRMTVKALRQPRHAAFVRVTHWLTLIAFTALLVTGGEILISHPRFYWGETGNVNTQPLFKIPIPSSRHMVPTGYAYTLPDQNGWSRYLHFEAAWLLVITGLVYFAFGGFTGHFRRDLLPKSAQLSLHSIARTCKDHLLFKRQGEEEAWSYNLLQRLSYLAVVFVMF